MQSYAKKSLVAAMVAALSLSPMLVACGPDSSGGGDNNVNANENENENENTNTQSNNNNVPGDLCLLNMCEEDIHCAACTEGRNTCLVAENRCVACNPNDGTGCPEGQICSSFGICVDEGLTCPTDNEGVPTVVCVENADCFACSPMNQVCNTTTHQCVACTETNTSHCLPSDICLDDRCSNPCPSSCDEDNDCENCEGANGCFQHKCSECSDTWPCAAGMVCENGSCVQPCGLIGPVAGTCEQDTDCEYCGDGTTGDWVCSIPIGSTHGVCAPPAAGCSDLGTGVVVLPDPWNQYTEMCSNDGDCISSGAGPDLNIGGIIRDQLGQSTIDVWITEITIGDALVQYDMSRCADIELTEELSCGICVPCIEDADCGPIDILPLLDDLLVGDGLSEFVIDLAINLIFGDNDPQINFYCQPVAAGFGACVPCSNPFQACGNTTPTTGSGTCDHDVCTEGTPLDPSCGDCAAAVCTADSYCCTDDWDSICVDQVDTECAVPCGGTATDCSPDICTNDALDAQNELCNDCVAAICADDPFCCNTASGAWDSYCMGATADPTYATECDPICNGGCMHSECDLGTPLDSTCSACAAAVCAADSFCCDTDWDQYCVDAAIADTADCGHCN